MSYNNVPAGMGWEMQLSPMVCCIIRDCLKSFNVQE